MTDTLPPLPEPLAWHCYWRGDNDSASWDQWHDASDPMPEKWDSEAPDEVTPYYTADELREYGARCSAAERERLRAALMEMHVAAKGQHNYFQCAAVELFGNHELTGPAGRSNDD